jgi:hypothetical protein
MEIVLCQIQPSYQLQLTYSVCPRKSKVKECGRREPRFADTTMLKCSLWFYITGQSCDLQIVHI